MKKKMLVIGSSAQGALELSYISAAKSNQIESEIFDPIKEEVKYIRGGKLGRMLHTILPVEQWIKKMNRGLIVFIKNKKPDIIMMFTGSRILPGTLMTIKLVCPGVKIVWLWPDTPMNLSSHNFLNGRLVDLTCTYSKDSVPLFKQLQFNNAVWIPLAGDLSMHGLKEDRHQFSIDISFVGGWRPERERIMHVICTHFPNKNIEIYGPYWKRDCKSTEVKKRLKGNGLFERELAQYFNRSRININVIDETNYPAANMRFFEIPTSFGLQVSSSCPEQEKIFRHREHVIYFQGEEDLVDQLAWAFDHEKRCAEIRYEANNLLNMEHTYSHRLNEILKLI